MFFKKLAYHTQLVLHTTILRLRPEKTGNGHLSMVHWSLFSRLICNNKKNHILTGVRSFPEPVSVVLVYTI